MSTQINDRLFYKSKCYDISAMSKSLDFWIDDYELEIYPFDTACQRGYIAIYEIKSGRLFVRNLEVSSGYVDFSMKIPFSGKILVGRYSTGLADLDMGFILPWDYRIVKEFTFRKGTLTAVKDLSLKALMMRRLGFQKEEIKKRFSERKNERFVENCFSLEYDVKAWWV